MISVELWRARIGHFNSKRYSGFLSSLFSSYVPFKFRRRRKRSSNVDTDAQQDLEQPSSGAASHQSRPPPPSASNSSGPPSLDESPLVSSLQQSLFFSWSFFLPTSFPRGLLSSCLLREALVRLVLLIAIISQVLIISGDVETNPGPLACE